MELDPFKSCQGGKRERVGQKEKLLFIYTIQHAQAVHPIKIRVHRTLISIDNFFSIL